MDLSTSAILAQLQKEDSYLGPIWEQVEKGKYPFPKFFIKDGVLYRKCMPKHSKSEQHAFCMPDVRLQLALLAIHLAMNHASVTQTLRHFEQYGYYSKNAKRIMISCIEACAHCALSRREEAQKAPLEPRPKRPRRKKGKKSEQRDLMRFQTPSDADTAA